MILLLKPNPDTSCFILRRLIRVIFNRLLDFIMKCFRFRPIILLFRQMLQIDSVINVIVFIRLVDTGMGLERSLPQKIGDILSLSYIVGFDPLRRASREVRRCSILVFPSWIFSRNWENSLLQSAIFSSLRHGDIDNYSLSIYTISGFQIYVKNILSNSTNKRGKKCLIRMYFQIGSEMHGK